MQKKYIWNDRDSIDEFLADQEIGHLSTIDDDGWPNTVPVNYIWHGGDIYIHGGLGRKVNNLRRDSKASFVVTEALGVLTVEITGSPCNDTQLGRSVLLRGNLREIRNPEQKLRLLNKLISKYDRAAARKLAEGHQAPEGISDQAAFHHCLLLELHVTAMTARQQLLIGKPEKYRTTVADYFQRRGQDSGGERDLKTALLINQALEKEGAG